MLKSKNNAPLRTLFTSLARQLSIVALISSSSLVDITAAPRPDAYGVWDRGENMDPAKYPFLRGTGHGQSWVDTEKSSGVYDWSELDKVLDYATQKNVSVSLCFEVGPKTPVWVSKLAYPKS